jgi:hypothetical protein
MNGLFRHEWLLINPYFVNRYYSYRVSQPLSDHARLCCFSCDVRKSVALYVSLEVYCLSSSNGHLLESLWRFLDSLISLGTCNGQFKNQSCECKVPDYRFFLITPLSDFFPVIFGFLKRMPIIGTILSHPAISRVSVVL